MSAGYNKVRGWRRACLALLSAHFAGNYTRLTHGSKNKRKEARGRAARDIIFIYLCVFVQDRHHLPFEHFAFKIPAGNGHLIALTLTLSGLAIYMIYFWFFPGVVQYEWPSWICLN
jgi:hypothetical protein